MRLRDLSDAGFREGAADAEHGVSGSRLTLVRLDGSIGPRVRYQ
jgi:hypothetical protein